MDDKRVDILGEIAGMKDYLPKKQRALCEYILADQMHISTMTVAELAEAAGVGTTTVLRLTERLGFESYNVFKKQLLENAVSRNTSSYQQMKDSFLKTGDEGEGALQEVAGKAIKCFQNFLIPANFEAMEKTVEAMLQAQTIHVTGARSSCSLSMYLHDSLRVFMPNVRMLSFRRDYLYDRIFEMKEDDLLFVISAWPCTKDTISIAELCKRRGVGIVLLTNTKLNPIARIADITIDTNSINDESTPIMFMSALVGVIREMGRRTSPKSSEALERLEEQLKEHDVIVWENDWK